MSSSSAPVDPTDRPGAWGTCAALALLVVLVGIARQIGLGFQLPAKGTTDERVYVQQIVAFESGVEHPEELSGSGSYPYLVSRLAYATWRKPVCTSAEIADHLACASSLELHIRRVVALLSLLAIPATWLLVSGFAARATALLAAALCSTSVFTQVLAQQGRPHGALLGFCTLALALAVRLQLRPTLVRALFAGLVGGLAFATLQSGLALLLPITVAILLGRGVTWGRRAALVATAALPFVLAFVWAYPFLFVRHVDPAQAGGHAWLGEGLFGLDMLDGSGFHPLAKGVWTYEPIGVALTLIAAALGVRLALRSLSARNRATPSGAPIAARESSMRPRAWSDRTRGAVVLASYLVPFLIVFGLYRSTYSRYALPFVPFLAWCGAWVLSPSPRWRRSWFAWIPASIVVVLQALLLARLCYARSRPDTMAQAAAWIERELPSTARLCVIPNDDVPLLRLPRERAALEPLVADLNSPISNLHWTAYQASLESGPWDEHARDIVPIRSVAPNRMVAAMIEDGVEYFVCPTYQHFRSRGFEELHRSLEEQGTVVATFSPLDDGSSNSFMTHEEYLTDPASFAWIDHLLHARSTGNVIEIWKIGRPR